MTMRETGYELDGIAQRLDALLNRSIGNRDMLTGPEKTEWRKLGKRIERALKHVETAVDMTGVPAQRSHIHSPIDPRRGR